MRYKIIGISAQMTDTSPQQRAKRLKKLRKMSGLSQAAFAKKHNFGIATINHWENLLGSSQGLTEKGAYRIVKAMKHENVICTEEWLLSGSGSPPTQLLPTRRKLTNMFQFDIDKADLQKMVDRQVEELGEKYCSFEVDDNAMEPHFNSGDIVVALQLNETIIPEYDNEICLIELKNGTKLLRQFRITNTGQYLLYNTNPDCAKQNAIMLDPSVKTVFQIVINYKWGSGTS